MAAAGSERGFLYRLRYTCAMCANNNIASQQQDFSEFSSSQTVHNINQHLTNFQN